MLFFFYNGGGVVAPRNIGCAVLFIGKVSGDVCHIYFSKMLVAVMASAYNCYLVIMWCNGLNCMLEDDLFVFVVIHDLVY